MSNAPTLREQWLDVKGMKIHCQTAGDSGSPVVLLHGAGLDAASLSWALLIGPLAESHRVFAPDLPGYGQSDRPTTPHTVRFYIDWLNDLLTALQLERASLVGLSLGGAIALGLTLDQPKRVHKLVLVDSYGMCTVALDRRSAAGELGVRAGSPVTLSTEATGADLHGERVVLGHKEGG